MSGAATRAELPGGRWHGQHGPIDIIVGADGDATALRAAHEAAWRRFEGVLAELVGELPLLRQPVGEHCALRGPIARRMWQACAPFSSHFITPMAAVAGAVAQELIGAYRRPGIRRAWVNNGGDIALHLAPGEAIGIGLFADLARLDAAMLARTRAGQWQPDERLSVRADEPVRGVATSGWRGRSFSLGIADSVTVLAATAAMADAAATVVANAVDVDAAGIERRPACELRDDTDLGRIAVTVAVPPLAPALRQRALDSGLRCARALQSRRLIHAAVLVCQGSLARLPAAQPLQCAESMVR